MLAAWKCGSIPCRNSSAQGGDMSDWLSGYVLANGLRLHYTRTGGERPPLVLAHGYSDDGLCWAPVARALEADYDIIMVDARGHGRSDAPLSGYGTLSLAEDLAAAIRALRLERPAVLGHSMGGATTLALAGLYPALPGAILIEDAGMFNMGAARTPDQAERQARMRADIERFAQTSREALIEQVRASQPAWPEDELGPWADSKKRLSPNVLNRADAAPVDWPALLPKIACPALLITADNDRGAMVTPEAAREMQGMIGGLEVVHVPGAGHSIRREQFAAYIDAVRGFLARWAAGRA